MNRKPIAEMSEDEKDQAIYSARYILEEYFEEAEKGNGISALSKATGYPLGVVREAIENIFGTKIKTK